MLDKFLSLPVLPEKPRSTGLTHVLDKGITLGSMESHLASYAEFADVWKFGWGTAYVEKLLLSKIGLLREHGITACLGGTGGSQRGECGIGSAYLPCLRLTMGVDVRSGW